MHLSRLRPGALLVATPRLVDPHFARSVVLMLQHDADGSLGVVLDRPTTIPVAEFLPDWEANTVEPAFVFHGGPVQPEVGIGLCIRFGSLEVVELTAPPVDDAPVRVFGGCAGWGPDQLAGEIAEGAWFVVDFEPADLVTAQPDGLWITVLKRQTSDLSIYSTYPPDPRMN
ncbi:MAG: YqgE/AlgH family protein [Acidimicrobiia bacterium]